MTNFSDSVQESVREFTQAASENRMILLIFKLQGGEQFGVNVFKVREVVECPPVHVVPGFDESVAGLIEVRDSVLPLVDLHKAMGIEAFDESVDGESDLALITEFCDRIQAFRINGIHKIVNLEWEDVQPPPLALRNLLCTAVAHVDDELVQILDLETICWDILFDRNMSRAKSTEAVDDNRTVLVVDDSLVARNMVAGVVESLGLKAQTFTDGQEIKEYLETLAESDVKRKISLIISDVEMPRMDGFAVTRFVKENEATAHLPVILHSSLSGTQNKQFAEKAGADEILSKFHEDQLQQVIRSYVEQN